MVRYRVTSVYDGDLRVVDYNNDFGEAVEGEDILVLRMTPAFTLTWFLGGIISLTIDDNPEGGMIMLAIGLNQEQKTKNPMAEEVESIKDIGCTSHTVI